MDEINYAAEKSIPMIKNCTDPTQTFRPKPYWNPQISLAVAERRLALKTFRRNPTTSNLDVLTKKTADAQQVHRMYKTEHWKQLFTGVDEKVSASDMWHRMRWVKGFKRQNCQIPSDKKEELLQSLAPDFVVPRQPVLNTSNSLLNDDFTLTELSHCLKKKDTAPGDDKITYSMIFMLPLVGKLYLLKVYNGIYKSGSVPNQWRDIKIVPIPKASPNPNAALKFRPISLISCVCKIFHSMMCKRLEWYVESNNIIPQFTSGYKKNQSCLDCLARFVSQIQIGFTNRTPTVAVFLDIENAYNNVLIDQLVGILDGLGVGYHMCQYLWNFLNRRILKIREYDGDEINVRWSSRGLAQGDPFSPLLFNIVTHNIGLGLYDVSILQYADDFVIYTQNKDSILNEIYIQSALDTITDFLGQLGLQLSSSKTQVCQFKRGRGSGQVSLTINNRDIDTVDCVKYLGMWIDKSLTWKKHIVESVQKVTKTVNLLKILAGPTWGLHPKHLRRLYIALVRSKIDFGSFLYDSAAKTNLYKLKKVQNIALRVIGGFIRSTPIHVMECELCIHPLHLRRQYLATKYCLKAHSSSHITVNILNELSEYIETEYWSRKKKPLLAVVFSETKLERLKVLSPLNMFRFNTWASNINMDFIYTEVEGIKDSKSRYDTRVLRANTLCMINVKYAGWHKLYTDGSKTGDGLGAAYFDARENFSVGYKIVSKYNSIMSVELLAISEALSYVLGNLNCKQVVIFSDSRSALQHIARCTSSSKGASIAYHILRKILALKEKDVDLRLQWIPSHVDIQGNDEADKHAKEAIAAGSEIYMVPEISELLCNYRYKVFERWKLYFGTISEDKGIWYHVLQENPPKIPWFSNCKMKRQWIVMAHRLRSGHMPLNKFNYLMRLVESDTCDICGRLEDVHHILVECPRTQSVRSAMLTQYGANFLDVGVIQSVLSAPLSDAARTLFHLMYNIINN